MCEKCAFSLFLSSSFAHSYELVFASVSAFALCLSSDADSSLPCGSPTSPFVVLLVCLHLVKSRAKERFAKLSLSPYLSQAHQRGSTSAESSRLRGTTTPRVTSAIRHQLSLVTCVCVSLLHSHSRHSHQRSHRKRGRIQSSSAIIIIFYYREAIPSSPEAARCGQLLFASFYLQFYCRASRLVARPQPQPQTHVTCASSIYA